MRGVRKIAASALIIYGQTSAAKPQQQSNGLDGWTATDDCCWAASSAIFVRQWLFLVEVCNAMLLHLFYW